MKEIMSKHISLSKLIKLKGFKIIHLNCCSLVNKIDIVKCSLLTHTNFDVVCITESWLKPHHADELFVVDGYNLFRFDRDLKHRHGSIMHGGGIAIYVKDRYIVETDKTKILCTDLEACKITISNEFMKKIHLCVVYRPPSGNLIKAMNQLSELTNEFTDGVAQLIICGDFNVDVSKVDHPSSRLISDFCSNLGLKQLIINPTRYGIVRNSIIDLIMTNCRYIASSDVINYNCSDHLPVYINIKKNKESYHKTKFVGRSYRNYVKEDFQQILYNHNWGRLYGTWDVNDAWDLIFDKIRMTADQLCPIKEFFVKKDHPVWFNHDIIEMAANRDMFYSLARKTKDHSLLLEAKRLKNLVKHRLSSIKSEYFLSELETNAHDTKKFWRNMDEIICKKKNVLIDRIKNSDDHVLMSTADSADALNNFYVTIADKLVEKMPPSEFETNFPVIIRKLKLDHVITCNQIENTLKDFSILKPSGCTKVSTRLYLDAFAVLLEPLAYIMNISLRSGIFPTAWKKSIVSPIPKKGDRYFVENTRPITLIHIAGKLLEKIVNTILTSHLKDYSILSDNQFGFTKGKSTTDCYMTLYSNLLNNFNHNLITCCVFLDYSKAFDTVNHQRLLEKLKKYGIEDIKWFRSYLSERFQAVKLGSHFSSFRSIGCGVPQGSVLGPTLFNIYLNDINYLPLSSTILLYADDVVLFSTNSNPDVSLSNVQNDLKLIEKWSVSNKLSVSTSKTKYMLFGRKANLHKNQISSALLLGGYPLELVHKFCYLGVTFDDLLSFNPMIDIMHRKAAYKFRTLLFVRKCMTTHCAITFVRSMILPYIDYGCLLLSTCSRQAIGRLQLLQNKMLRCALRVNRHTNIRELHSKCGILMIDDRIKYNQLKFIYVNILSKSPLFAQRAHTALTTRSILVGKLSVCTPNYSLIRKSIIYDGILLWNRLDENIKNATSLASFKRRLKLKFLDEYTR